MIQSEASTRQGIFSAKVVLNCGSILQQIYGDQYELSPKVVTHIVNVNI